MSDQAGAGWHPDPNGNAELRWWDGHRWTEHVQAVPPPAPGPGSPDAGAQELVARLAREREAKAAAKAEAKANKHRAKAAPLPVATVQTPGPSETESAAGQDAPDLSAVRPDIKAARDRMAVKVGSKREIRKLLDHLWHDEQVERLAAGVYGGGLGLIALTDRRLLFLKDGHFSQTNEDFPIEKIASVQWSAGMLHGGIIVFASGNKAEFAQVNKADGKAMADAIRARISTGPEAAPVPPAPAVTAAPQVDVISQLKQLGELRDSGILTEDEFQAQKAKLLN